jgi:hypothetical protein
MKWDIDKALASLEDPKTAGTDICRVMVDVTNPQLLADLRLSAPKTDLKVLPAWVLCLGPMMGRKLMVYGWTIREAHLKARRDVKKMTLSMRQAYGLPTPKKRSNSYASARRSRK